MEPDATPQRQDVGGEQLEPDPRRWRALLVLGLIHFMLVLDVTVVNVALPRIQQELGFSPAGLAWVVNGYVIMAGGLLLLGGRIADIYGRRRMFMVGVALFALASAVCGAAFNAEMMVIGRFVQGVGEALAAPASLGLITLLFRDPGERAKAYGIWGGLTSLAGIGGVVISGALVDLASWRWIFFINLPIAVLGLVMVVRLVAESKMVRDGSRPHFAGALIGTAGLVAIVYGLLQAAEHAWGSWSVLGPLLGGVVLLAVMVFVESRSTAPLIPLSFFANRTRVTANVVSVFFGAGFYSQVFLMSLFLQQVLGYTPLQGGLAGVPSGVAMVLGIGLGSGLITKLGARTVMTVSFFGSAAGLLLLSGLEVDSTFIGGVLPGTFLLGLFTGFGMPAILGAALHEVTEQDSSLGSGVQDTMAQVGTALGLAFLVTFALRHANNEIGAGVPVNVAATDGYTMAFQIAAGLFALSGVLALLLLEKVQVTGPGGEGGPGVERQPAA
ncbi:MFS transporter [Actinosynnema sp. CS-041913]|uniref:MFS transporter n=1 Tax=Actinosynnema sp. CS-041913 TaxID=3239917 RepID=UPI003D90B677